MTVDIPKLRQFLDKMDYEGGLGEFIGYGVFPSGDAELDLIMDQLTQLHKEARIRINHLYATYPELNEVGEDEVW